MEGQDIILIVINGSDIASTNQADKLLEMGNWQVLEDVENKIAYSLINVRMWIMPDGVLFEDDLDLRWQKETGEVVSEVIFPSRHAAASGQASLTIHPIGITGVVEGEEIRYGGRAGDAPPPNPRIASWWRELNRLTNNIQASDGENDLKRFELSLEVTHHGPWLSSPSLFIEVGSTAETWHHQGAADLLARIIFSGLALDGGAGFGKWDEDKNSGELVVITLGGGHYAPRGNLLGINEGIWIGHMLANYALPFIAPDLDGEPVMGQWKNSIDAAIKSTMKSFPGGKIIFSWDKKSFKGWQRQAIRNRAAELEIPLLNSKSILEML
jgi:D-aminoacyl-tRNA deacylase